MIITRKICKICLQEKKFRITSPQEIKCICGDCWQDILEIGNHEGI